MEVTICDLQQGETMVASPADVLDWGQVVITVDGFGRLSVFRPDGILHEGAVPVRSFPTNDPLRWISFTDIQGKELLLLESLDQLAPESRKVVEQELARREFQPRIERIVEARPGSSQTDWRVVTDRGEVAFATTTEESVRAQGEQGVVVTDTRGIRYLIPDRRSLDEQSQKILRRFL
ncbi:MAG: DUF1854 domain-containing protein [Planctomycetaceae bacterium]